MIEPEKFTDSGGFEVVICYGICRCNVWPLSFGAPVGRCGRCGERPDTLDPFLFNTKQEALEVFYERHGHYPNPVERST